MKIIMTIKMTMTMAMAMTVVMMATITTTTPTTMAATSATTPTIRTQQRHPQPRDRIFSDLAATKFFKLHRAEVPNWSIHGIAL